MRSVWIVLAVALAVFPWTSACRAGTTELVSVSSAGEQAKSESAGPAISADGRYVAFMSLATNLVPEDTNVNYDVFVHDRATGITELVSVSSAEEQGNEWSGEPSISADGRYVAFSSYASNLVAEDTNGFSDIFVHDRVIGVTEHVSVSSAGDKGNASSESPCVSADGRYVAFMSGAINLVPGDTNGAWDVFVHDRQTGQTERVSVSGAGEQGSGGWPWWGGSYSPSISADGRYVAFVSEAINLVPGDTNGASDVFVHDRQTGQTEHVSVSSAGEKGNASSRSPCISADGRYVAFVSKATNLVPGDTNGASDVFVHDRLTGTTERVSISSAGEQSNSASDSVMGGSLSAGGRYVTFSSHASNLVAGDTNGTMDVFVHDRVTGTTERVNLSSAGEQSNSGSSWGNSLSGDGRYIAFVSSASNLVAGDTNGYEDVFVRDRWGTGTDLDTPYPTEDDWSTYYPHRGQLHAHYMPDSVEPWVDSYHLVGGIPVGVALGPIPAAGAQMSAARSSLVALYGLCGYDFVAITEHQPDSKFSDYTWDKVFEDASAGGVLTLLGSAEDTADTHILGVGFGMAIDPDVMGGDGSLEHLEERLANITDNGGLAFAAHPDSTDYPWRSSTFNRLKNMAGRYQGLELYNTAVYYTSYRHGISAPLAEGFAVDAWDDLLHTGWNEVRTTWGTAGDDYTPNIYQGWAWLDDACVVVWTTSATPNQDQIKEALRAGRFYACKGGSNAPEILAYWVDPGTHTITVQLPEPYEVTFVRGRWGRRPEVVTPTYHGDLTYIATYTYAADDIYVRTEVRDNKGNTSWLQPIWIDQLQTKAGVLASALPGSFRAASLEPTVLEMEGATLTVSAPQTGVTYVGGDLLAGEARPPAPPMAYLSRCYDFTPEVTIQGGNSLAISYFPDSVRGFPSSALAVYGWDDASQTWVRLDGVVDEGSATVTAPLTQLGIFTVSAEEPADAEAPTVTITSPAPGVEVSTPSAITADASDDQGVASVSFYVGGWPLGEDNWGGDGFAATLDPANYTAGEKTIAAIAEDGVGYQATAETTITVAGLMLAPGMTISSPAEAEVVWGDLRANGNWNGQLPMTLGVFTLDDQPLTATPPTDGPWQISVAMDVEQAGERTLKATGFDIYGNRAEVTVSVTIRVFSDIPLGFWARDHIYATARAGIVQGYPEGDYKPDLAVTRDQMAVYIARAMAGGDAHVPDAECSRPPFTDVPCDQWARKYIAYAVSRGVVEGYPEGDYGPEEIVTRDQMAVYVARSIATPVGEAGLADYVPADPRNFPDVPNTGFGPDGSDPFWAYKHIEYCVEQGVVNGYDDGLYHPDWVVTRDQMAVYVARAFGLTM